MTRRRRILLVLALVAVALLLALLWLSRPRSVAAIVTHQLGTALGLDIEARGIAEYRMRGKPMLVLRDVRVRETGSPDLLLSAQRLHVTLPWSTLRAGGSELVAHRIEVDSPRIDLPALQHWLASRPPAEKRMPTLTDGLRIRDGEIRSGDWRIDRIDADVPVLDPTKVLRARLRGRYLDTPLSVPVTLSLAVLRPESLIKSGTTGFATHGTFVVEHGKDWRLPATVSLSGPLRIGTGDVRIAPARLGMGATYESGTTRIPFALGAHGPLGFDRAVWTLAPANIALRPRKGDASDPVPDLDAHGRLALGDRLALQLDGRLPEWPASWPALPPPVGQSRSALSFAMRYDGAATLDEVANLRLARDGAHFDGRFRLPQVLEWIEREDGSPLPPLSGAISAPKIEISGAVLEGVQIEFDDPDVPAQERAP